MQVERSWHRRVEEIVFVVVVVGLLDVDDGRLERSMHGKAVREVAWMMSTAAVDAPLFVPHKHSPNFVGG